MYTFVTLSLALGASALVVPRASNSSCSFELTASGGESGTIGQLSDGQNRIGGGLSAATFSIDNGGITDAAGRGCILTPSVEQFQCDQGVGPTYGFSIASNGSLEHAGSSVFYACPASDTEWNLYTIPVAGQLKCVEISLTASGCYSGSGCGASSVAPASTVTVTSVSTTTVYDCTASSAAGVAPSAPSVVVSSALVVVSSAPAASGSSQSVPAQASTAPIVVASTAPVVQTTAPAETVPAGSSPAASVPAESSQASVPAVASSVPVIETTAPAATVPVIATSEASTPVEVSSTLVESTTPVVQATSVVSVAQSSSVIASSVAGETTATVVPVEQTSSVYVQTTVPAQSPSTATSVQQSTQVESSTIITPVQETTSVYSHSYVVPPVSSTSIITTPTTAYTTSIPIATVSSSRYLANTTYASTTSTPIASSATSSASSCVATTLSTTYEGNYEYPHLIIPISSSTPSTAAGTQYFGTISSNTSTIFNFDIPSSYSGSTCNLIFLLPLQSELETSSYTFSGAGTVDFEQLSSVATESTDYDNAPSVEADLGTFTLSEGSSTLVKSFECSEFAGGDVAFEMKSVGGTYLRFFQDWNPSPLGLYITYC